MLGTWSRLRDPKWGTQKASGKLYCRKKSQKSSRSLTRLVGKGGALTVISISLQKKVKPLSLTQSKWSAALSKRKSSWIQEPWKSSQPLINSKLSICILQLGKTSQRHQKSHLRPIRNWWTMLAAASRLLILTIQARNYWSTVELALGEQGPQSLSSTLCCSSMPNKVTNHRLRFLQSKSWASWGSKDGICAKKQSNTNISSGFWNKNCCDCHVYSITYFKLKLVLN